MKGILGSTIALIALLILALLFGSFKNPAARPLLVGSSVWPGYEPLFLARALGFWDEKEIRLVEAASATQVLRIFRNGDIHAAALTLDECLLLLQDGIDARVFLVLDISHGGDAILTHPDFSTFDDLRRRRIGFESTALGSYVLARAFEIHGVDPSTIEFIPLEVNEHERAFREGRIDAVVTYEPVRSRLLQEGARVVFDSRQIPNEIVDVLIARGEIFNSQEKNLHVLTHGWFRALDYFEQHPEDAVSHMIGRMNLSPKELLTAYEGLRLPDLDANQELLVDGKRDFLRSAHRLREVMLDHELLRQKPSLVNLVEGSVVSRLPSHWP